LHNSDITAAQDFTLCGAGGTTLSVVLDPSCVAAIT
jgi:hypothetical protein